MGGILNLIENKEVFSVELQENKKSLVITEMCDQCWSVELKKSDVYMLINELTEIFNEMEH